MNSLQLKRLQNIIWPLRQTHPDWYWQCLDTTIRDEIAAEYHPHWNDRVRWVIEPLLDRIRGRSVVDLASGMGVFGITARAVGARSVTLFDIRARHYEDYLAATGQGVFNDLDWQWGNMESSEDLAQVLADQDVVIYAGHWYHTARHHQILSDILASPAETILLESLTLRDNLPQQYLFTVNWHKDIWTDPKTEPWQAHDRPPGGFNWVGHPTMPWTLTLLESLGYTDLKISNYCQPDGDIRWWILIER